MPRMDPVARAAIRARSKQKADEVMGKGPVQRIIEKGIKFVEDVNGLNIGGPESGRIAREKAIKKYRKSLKTTEKYAP